MKEIIKRILKEDINKKYLDKIVDHMIKHYTDVSYYYLKFNKTVQFTDYLTNTFGLTDDEIEYVYRRYLYKKI